MGDDREDTRTVFIKEKGERLLTSGASGEGLGGKISLGGNRSLQETANTQEKRDGQAFGATLR